MSQTAHENSGLQTPAPPAWYVQQGPADPGGRNLDDGLLCLGSKTVHLADIHSFKVEECIERDVNGLLLAGAGFSIFGTIFLMGVIDYGWRERFLLGFVILLILGIASILEAPGINAARFQELTITTGDGRNVRFSCADVNEMARLTAFLQSVVVSRG